MPKVKEDLYLDYIKLRYKAKLNPGKTGDEIMDSHYFCNIKREWDSVSSYIIKEIIEAKTFKDTGKEMSKWDILRNIFLARMHNKIETLRQYEVPSKHYDIKDEEIAKKQNPHAYRTQKFLQRLKNQTEGWEDSVWCVGNHLEKVIPDELLEQQDWSSFVNAMQSWSQVLGLAIDSFIVYQLSLDLEWLWNYKDIDEFFVLGPGAIRGINMVYYQEEKMRQIIDSSYESKGSTGEFNGVLIEPAKDLLLDAEGLMDKYHFSKDNFSDLMEGKDYDNDIRKLHKFVNTSEWAKNNDLYIHINDIEFNLCEFNKYYSKKMGWKTTLRKYEKKA